MLYNKEKSQYATNMDANKQLVNGKYVNLTGQHKVLPLVNFPVVFC